MTVSFMRGGSGTVLPFDSMIDTVHQWNSRRVNPYRLASLDRVMGASLLDVGCGNGGYVDHFARNTHAIGMDVNAYPSWKKQRGEYLIGSVDSIPFQDDAFDCVSCFEVIEHVDDPASAMDELARVCRRNLILTVPNCELTSGLENSRLAYFHFTDSSHKHFFTVKSFRTLVQSAGLRILEQTLINPIDPYPFIAEAVGGPAWLWRSVKRLRRRAEHKMTILISAQKGRG